MMFAPGHGIHISSGPCHCVYMFLGLSQPGGVLHVLLSVILVFCHITLPLAQQLLRNSLGNDQCFRLYVTCSDILLKVEQIFT